MLVMQAYLWTFVLLDGVSGQCSALLPACTAVNQPMPNWTAIKLMVVATHTAVRAVR